MHLFTSSSCGQCHSLLQLPLVRDLQNRGQLHVVELHGVDQTTREQLLNRFSKDRMVPFLVYKTTQGGYTSLVGKTQIADALSGRHQ